LTSQSGVNPSLAAAGVWAVAAFFAGLIGVLAAPVIGLTSTNFTVLITAAFAAVIAARLTSLWIAVVVGLLMGVATSLAQGYIPSSSEFASAALPSIPFAIIALFLLYSLIRGIDVREVTAIGGPLDRAIAAKPTTAVTSSRRTLVGPRLFTSPNALFALACIGIVALLPVILQGYWVGLVAEGLAYGIIFLSYTLVTGEGGMIWLCQITFAGIGAVSTAQLATNHHWPVLLAILVGAAICGVLGTLVGVLTIRMGDLYVALTTLTLGILVDNLVFGLNVFSNLGNGVPVHWPAFIGGYAQLTWFILGVFCLFALFIVNFRRSTAGMALTAARGSEIAARMSGVEVVRLKLVAASIAAMMAGVGGGLLACYSQVASPPTFATFIGLVWLSVLVTNGIRSVTAAMVAGLCLSMIPALFLAYLPTSWAEVPTALFGLGAIFVARNPDGIFETQGRRLEELMSRLRRRRIVA
jgi:branched-chain amino acid transport system permease protein